MAGAPSGTSSSSSHSTGWRMNGSVCGPPSPPCEPISSSNAATSPSSGSYWLSSSRSGAWTIASSRLRLMIVCGPNSVVGSSPSTRSSSRIARAVRAEHDRAESAFERTSSSPTPGCAATAATRPGMQLLELLDRQPVVMAGEPDEPEVARADDGDRRRRRRRRLRPRRRRDRRRRRSSCSSAARATRRADALGLGDLRQERVHEGRPFGLGLGLDDVARPLISSRTYSPRLTP